MFTISRGTSSKIFKMLQNLVQRRDRLQIKVTVGAMQRLKREMGEVAWG